MPVVHNIFVIHSYRHDGNAQHELIGMLRQRRRFHFQDHSIPNVSLYRGMRLKAEIRKRMSLADVVLMLARPAAGKSVHVRYEVRLAAKLGKPIIAVRPQDGVRTSSFAQQHALAIVDWEVEKIVQQIRNPGRTSREGEVIAAAIDAPVEDKLHCYQTSSSDVPNREDVLRKIARLDALTTTGMPLPPDRSVF